MKWQEVLKGLGVYPYGDRQQSELARALGVSRQAIHDYVKHNYTVHAGHLDKVQTIAKEWGTHENGTNA